MVRDRDALQRLGSVARTGPYVAQAALAVVVAVEKTQYAVSDASRAIQSMMLAAWSDGVGSNRVGFGGLEAVRPLLDIPGHLDVLAVVPFGYLATSIGRGRKHRRPLTEVAHRERFHQPFE